MYKILTVIPALNEESSITSVINNCKLVSDVLIINDGSTDKTETVSTLAGANVISNDTNIGVDKSLLKGFEFGYNNGYDYIITIDADGQHTSESFDEIIKYINSSISFDFIQPYRSKYARFSERIFRLFYSIFYQIQDPICGLKCIKTDVYKDILKWRYKTNYGAIYSLFAAKRKLKVIQFKINTADRHDESRIGGIIKSNYRIFKALLNNMK